VREVLCDLELPYLLHNVAKGSPWRPVFAERSGQGWAPFLYDPKAEVAWFGSRDIVAYLEAAYAQ
jgi:glutathione S-transferase